MESQVTTPAEIDLSVLRLKPEHLTFLEILRDSASVSRRNFVPRKPADIIEERLTDCCSEQVAKAKQVQTLSLRFCCWRGTPSSGLGSLPRVLVNSTLFMVSY